MPQQQLPPQQQQLNIQPNYLQAQPQTVKLISPVPVANMPNMPNQMDMHQPNNVYNIQPHYNSASLDVNKQPMMMTPIQPAMAPYEPNMTNNNNQTFPMINTMSFIDKQQQMISDNLNTSVDSTKSPAKKLTKKQLKALENGEPMPEKTPKQRKIKPKKGSLDNSMDAEGVCNEIEGINRPELPASTQSKIDATIDDFMKQYKMKNKKKKKDGLNESEVGDDEDGDDDDESDESDDEELNPEDARMRKTDAKDATFEGEVDSDEEVKAKKAKKPKGGAKKAKKSKKADSDMDDDSNAFKAETDGVAPDLETTGTQKKRRYVKKKNVSILLDEQNTSTLEGVTDSNSGLPSASLTAVKLMNEGDESISMMSSDADTSKMRRIAGPSNRGRRRSAHLVKLMKNKKKKRKRTSSGEEEVEDDDSDDFELTCSTAAAMSKAKKEVDSAAQVASTGSNDGTSKEEGGEAMNDEQAAKLLQANEKRRSTRATKKQKYNDLNELKDEDLIIPKTEEELAAEAEAEAALASNAANIVLSTTESFVVDKILGNRMFKRKTKRRKEKTPKEKKEVIKKDEPKVEIKPEVEPSADSKPAEVKNEEANNEIKPINEEVKEEMDTGEAVNGDEKKVDAPIEADKKMEDVDSSASMNVDAAEQANSNIDEKSKENEPPLKADESAIAQTNGEKTELDAEATKENGVESAEKPNETEPIVAAEAKEEVSKKVEPVEKEIEDEEDEESEWEEDGGEIEVEEFYVKYKNFSYLHCEWRTRDEIYISDKRIDQKIKRYRVKKQQQAYNEWNEDESGEMINGDELFNPDYTEVDRLLDSYDMDDPHKPSQKLKYFLIKWKALAYDEASWELEADVKNAKKIEWYQHINTLVPDVHMKVVAKPRADKWVPMSETREYKNGNKLREYQLEGINWLTFCWLNNRNCILADEMGLGKTVQSVTFLHEMANYGVKGPYLVLVPLSTIGNWMREFERWTDFNAIVYHGSSASRQMLQDYEFYFKDAEVEKVLGPNTKSKNIVKFNALITTYEVLLSDVTLFCQFKWRSVIIDEAHRLKNKNCKLIEGLRYMDVEHKVLLTGTPLQNNVEELFSLLHFLEPQQFHSVQDFLQEFGDLKTDTQVTKLQSILKPMMLRRLKEDVEKNLAPKEETIVEVELTNTQKKYYRAILEKNFQFLSRGASSSNVPNLMNTMMELRKCCNHPYLINGRLFFVFFYDFS